MYGPIAIRIGIAIAIELYASICRRIYQCLSMGNAPVDYPNAHMLNASLTLS